MSELNIAIIKEKLQEQNKSIRQLAKETDINVSTISRIFNGKRKATLDHLKRISHALQIPLSDLMDSEEYGEDISSTFQHVRSIIKTMQIPVENFTLAALKNNLQEYQTESAKAKGRETILNSFHTKLSELGGKGPLIQQLKRMFTLFKEQNATKKELLLIGSALFYFIASVDMIPDYLFPVGFLDDALVIQYVTQSLNMKQ
ncbi:helix-turn-helix domain-containing protein [Gracilibacillus xinjiangensis]|uniref:Helix-turn-helix domain-containing protein n=1 Tax=Gracilibacillus xinjiangensis TaxID=1193282 RepID=A0ABV8WVD1_9BACI